MKHYHWESLIEKKKEKKKTHTSYNMDKLPIQLLINFEMENKQTGKLSNISIKYDIRAHKVQIDVHKAQTGV